MNKIKFYHLTSTLNIILVSILVLLGGLLVVNLFIELPKEVGFICFLYMFIYWSKPFFFKNYFEWNDKGATLKVNKFLSYGKHINFSQINQYQRLDSKIEFIQKDNEVLEFDISNIRKEDIAKLDTILAKYIPQAKPSH